jgi:hypothetical protein
MSGSPSGLNCCMPVICVLLRNMGSWGPTPLGFDNQPGPSSKASDSLPDLKHCAVNTACRVAPSWAQGLEKMSVIC